MKKLLFSLTLAVLLFSLVTTVFSLVFVLELRQQIAGTTTALDRSGDGWLMLRPYGLWSFPRGLNDSNLDGFRVADDVTESKPAGTYRVAVLGGSAVWGHNVSPEQTIPARLQAHLTAEDPGQTYQVLNFAIPGYTSSTELVLLALKVLRYRPDLVVVLDGWNDFIARVYPPHYNRFIHTYKQILDQANAGFSLEEMAARQLFQTTFTGRAVIPLVLGREAKDENPRVQRAMDVARDELTRPLPASGLGIHETYQDNLLAMAGICEAIGAEAIFAIQPYDSPSPYSEEADDVYPGLVSGLFGVGARSAARCFSLVEFLPDDPPEATYLDHIHFSSFGNDLVARGLAYLVLNREVEDGQLVVRSMTRSAGGQLDVEFAAVPGL